jgi:hypothetical protein
MQYSQRPAEWQLYFHNSIPDIICIKDDASDGLSFTLKVRDVLVLEERYTWDTNGKIRVRNLGEIIEKFLDTTATVDRADVVSYLWNATPIVEFKFTEVDTEYVGNFIACKCDVDLGNLNDSSWATRNFLTRCLGTKKTALDRKETLSYLQKDTDNFLYLVAKITYLTNGAITEQQGNLTLFGHAPNTTHSHIIATLNTSLLYVLNQFGLPHSTEVLNYQVWISSTSNGESGTLCNAYTYLVDATPYRDIANFLFLNAFGTLETFTATGLKTTEKTAEYNLGNIDNHYRKLTQDFKSEQTCNSGFLSENEMEWADDLVRSYMVALVSGNKITQITLTGMSKTDTEANVLQSFTFSYQVAKNKNFMFMSKHIGIFDAAFDNTFQ